MRPVDVRPLRGHLVLLRPPRIAMSLVAAAAARLFAIRNFVFCPFEEERLRAAFPGYAAYAARVRRWL